MKRQLSKVGVVVALISTALGTGLTATADAAVLNCGDIIFQSTVLENDVGPCSLGITIGADGITLDLNGHTVSGRPDQVGEGAGIFLRNRTGVTVRNGTVRDFDGGVVIEGGSGNTVTAISAQHNIGRLGATAYGDGIAIMCSQNNRIIRNVAFHNGTFSGIGVYSRGAPFEHPCLVAAVSRGNLIDGNTVVDNNLPRSAQINDSDGIRVESLSTHNSITNNRVTGSGLDGISLFSFTPDNVVRFNVVSDNGFLNTFRRRGDGIRVFGGADRSVVENNRVTRNAANGIILHGPLQQAGGVVRPGATQSRVVGNVAVDNNRLPPIENLPTPPGFSQLGGLTFDLHDANVDCDANVWLRNVYRTAFPPCTTTGGTQA